MAPPKKNEFLDASDSEDDQVGGYDSQDEITKGGRSAKRRKVGSDEDSAGSDFEGNDSDAGDEEPKPKEDGPSASDDKKDNGKEKAKKLSPTTDASSMKRPLTKKNLVASDAAIKKSGVVYLSRVPPFLKPNKLRSLLQQYGTINRIFLAPEDPSSRSRRIRAGGNKKRSFTEGWVEFVKKKDAKTVCELLNARNIGGKKGSYYHDDIWNLIYLKGFKWHNLTEQIAAEDAERASRMRAEISKTTKENKDFLANVERAKMLDGMHAQAKEKKRKAGGMEDGEAPPKPVREHTRTFKQVPLAKKPLESEQQPERVTRALSKIF